MRSSSWARARSKTAALTSGLAQTRFFGLGAERMLSRIGNSLARDSARWAKIWFTVLAILAVVLAVVYPHFG